MRGLGRCSSSDVVFVWVCTFSACWQLHHQPPFEATASAFGAAIFDFLKREPSRRVVCSHGACVHKRKEMEGDAMLEHSGLSQQCEKALGLALIVMALMHTADTESRAL